MDFMQVKQFLLKTKAWVKRSLYAQMLFIALAFALMVIANYYFGSSIERKNLQDKVKDAILYTETRINAEMLEPETAVGSIAETIRSMILHGYNAEVLQEYIKDINNYVQSNEQNRLVGVNGFYGYFDVFDGLIINGGADWVSPDDFVLQERLWYIAAVEADGDIGVTQPYFNFLAPEKESITFGRRIFDEDGNPLGIVCLNIYLDRIRKLAVDTQFAENGYGFLLNRDMKLIAHPDHSLLGVQLRNVKSYISAYEDELKQKGHIYEITTTDYRGIKSIVFIEKLQNGWYMGIVTPRDKFYQGIRSMVKILTTLGTVLAAILIIILMRINVEKDKADERMRIMFDAMPLGANIHDAKFDFFDCNEGAVKMFGLSSKQEFREKFFELWPKYQPDGELSSKKMDKLHEKVYNDGYCRYEWMYQNPKGELIPGETILVRVKYNNEFVVAAFMLDLREIAASKRTTTILENILNSIDAQIYVSVPHTGEILFVNDYMKKLFNLDNDCVGKLCYKIFVPDRDEICDFCPCYQLDKDPNGTFVWEMRHPIHNRIYRNTDRYIEWYDGRTVLIQYSIDETDLISAKEQAIQANEAKSNFLAKVSHEVRTPMNAILGITEIQLQDETLLPGTQDALGQIYNSGYLLLGIINDILDLSKIEAGKLELTPVNYDVPSLINDTVHLNIMRFDSKPIEFILRADENIPTTLFGDELRIKQILNNLLSNAFKYTESGEITLAITSEEQKGEVDGIILVFRVSDTGQGMSAEQLDKLFEEYTRFNSEANRTTVGTGLGMNIARYLAQMMNGEILVESELGKGSVFTVRLPQGTIAGSSVLGRELAENLGLFRLGRAGQMKKAPQIIREYMPYGRVLIVDDVETNLYVAKGLMSPYGLSLETAISGFEAVEKIKNGLTYDIIFMDHFMPKMDGIEAVKIIRGLGYTPPIVALTANALTGQAEMFLANGFDGFISKPIDIRQLNYTLNKLIRDKYPAETVEAARQHKENLDKNSANGLLLSSVNMELKKVFVRDAEKAAAMLEAIQAKEGNYDEKDILAYIINVHAMKSALANIGETTLSVVAEKLEQAGRARDITVMTSETADFLNSLRTVVEKVKPKEVDEGSETKVTDNDRAYLLEKLTALQAACAEYDKKTAKTVLVELREKTWPRPVRELLDVIAEHLLHSEFSEAADIAGKYAQDEHLQNRA